MVQLLQYNGYIVVGLDTPVNRVTDTSNIMIEFDVSSRALLKCAVGFVIITW